MRIRTPGRINERLWCLGREDSTVYLLEGESGYLLINGGLSSLLPDFLQQLEVFEIDDSRINKILILHSHFDHVGLIPYLLRRRKDVQLYASQRAFEVFKKAKAVQGINQASLLDLSNRGLDSLWKMYPLEWQAGLSGKAVKEGERIEHDDFEVQIFETPGHSPCSISAYIPELKTLFPSDGGGIPVADKIAPYGTSNFTQFEQSLQKLQLLDVDCLCSDHCGYVAGDEAAAFITDSIAAAAERRRLMTEVYEQTQSIDETSQVLADMFADENIGKQVPHATLVEAFRVMINHVVTSKA